MNGDLCLWKEREVFCRMPILCPLATNFTHCIVTMCSWQCMGSSFPNNSAMHDSFVQMGRCFTHRLQHSISNKWLLCCSIWGTIEEYLHGWEIKNSSSVMDAILGFIYVGRLFYRCCKMWSQPSLRCQQNTKSWRIWPFWNVSIVTTVLWRRVLLKIQKLYWGMVQNPTMASPMWKFLSNNFSTGLLFHLGAKISKISPVFLSRFCDEYCYNVW